MRASHAAKMLAATALKKNVTQQAKAARKNQTSFAAELAVAKKQASESSVRANKQKA